MKDFRIEDGKSLMKVEWEREIDRGKGEKGMNEKEWESIRTGWRERETEKRESKRVQLVQTECTFNAVRPPGS